MNTKGEFGNFREPELTNTPGSRYGCNLWTDTSDNIYLFGGKGFNTGSG